MSIRNEIQKLYIGYLGRAADLEGLDYWEGRIETGTMTLDQLRLNMVTDQPEYQEMYGGLDRAQTASKIYENLFNRAPDSEGLEYWVNGEGAAVPIDQLILAYMAGAQGTDAVMMANRVTVADYYTENIGDFYTIESAREVLTDVSFESNTVAAAKSLVDAWAAGGGDTVVLTTDADIVTANIFEAPRGWTPGGNDQMNTLNDDDVLTGTGENPTLNFTHVTDADTGTTIITPTLDGVETINILAATGTLINPTLDLQNATGVDSVNVNRVNNFNYNVQNMREIPSDLSVNNTNAPANNVNFTWVDSALAGDADETNLTLNNAQVGQMVFQGQQGNEGFEIINLASTGSANAVGQFVAEDLQSLFISGDQNLEMGDTEDVLQVVNGRVEAVRYVPGLANVAGSLSLIDASELDGDISIVLGAETVAIQDGTSGVPVDFTYLGSRGDDEVVLTAGIDDGDVIDGGGGDNLVAVTATVNAGNIENFQDLDVRSQTAAVDNIVINADVFGGLDNISVRNEGQVFNAAAGQWVASANNTMTVTLNNLTADQAQNITIYHGNTGNNGLADNILNVNTAGNTVGVAIEDGVNVDPRFNFQLTTSDNVRNVTLHDNDTESNSVQLNSFARHTGTITVEGGREGQFMNLDVGANGYGFVTTGADGDFTTLVETIDANNPSLAAAGLAQPSARDDAVGTVFRSIPGGELLVASDIDTTAFAGDFIARVGEADQNIQLGSGDNTIIFADRAGITAGTSGLTISDTVAAGDGFDTIVLDGVGTQLLDASEWTNLSGIDAIRLAGAPGAADFTLQLSNDLVNQTDDGSRIVIWNNDGDLRTIDENTATIDLTDLNANNFVTFVGANGDGSAIHAGRAAQTVIVNDVTANGGSILDGGNRDVVTDWTDVGAGRTFATQADANAAYNALLAANQVGNNNVYTVKSNGSNAQVTVGDLANTSNFSTIQWENDTAVQRTMTLTLNNATVDRLVDANHAANNVARETLRIESIDSTTVAGATANLTINAGTLNNSFNLQIMGSRGQDNIATGAGNDIVVLAGNYATGTYGVDPVTGFDLDARANDLAGAHVATDTINMGGGFDTLVTYGAIDLTGATLIDVNALVAFSGLVLTADQFRALDSLSFEGDQNHALRIIGDDGPPLDLGKITLKDEGSLLWDVRQADGTFPPAGVTGTPTIDGTGVIVQGEVDPADPKFPVDPPVPPGEVTVSVDDAMVGESMTATVTVMVDNDTNEDITGALELIILEGDAPVRVIEQEVTVQAGTAESFAIEFEADFGTGEFPMFADFAGAVSDPAVLTVTEDPDPEFVIVPVTGDASFDADALRVDDMAVKFVFEAPPEDSGLVSIENFSDGDVLQTGFDVTDDSQIFIEAGGTTVAVAFGDDVMSFQEIWNVNLLGVDADLVSDVQAADTLEDQVQLMAVEYGDNWIM